MPWKIRNPFIQTYTVQKEEIDFLHHTNNKAYLNWMEQVAWQHSLAVGIDHNTQKRLNRIMIVKEHKMSYHAGSYLGDELLMGTWVDTPNGCCLRNRHYQIIRPKDNITVFTATTQFVCVDLKTLRPKPLPREFIEAYQSV